MSHHFPFTVAFAFFLIPPLTTACGDSGIAMPGGTLSTRPLTLTATHLAWWDEVTECAEATPRDPSSVRFHEVLAPLTPSRQQFPCLTSAQLCSGLYTGSDIYIASGMVGSERTMKHEMLHALIGAPEHPPVFLRCT